MQSYLNKEEDDFDLEMVTDFKPNNYYYCQSLSRSCISDAKLFRENNDYCGGCGLSLCKKCYKEMYNNNDGFNGERCDTCLKKRCKICSVKLNMYWDYDINYGVCEKCKSKAVDFFRVIGNICLSDVYGNKNVRNKLNVISYFIDNDMYKLKYAIDSFEKLKGNFWEVKYNYWYNNNDDYDNDEYNFSSNKEFKLKKVIYKIDTILYTKRILFNLGFDLSDQSTFIKISQYNIFVDIYIYLIKFLKENVMNSNIGSVDLNRKINNPEYDLEMFYNSISPFIDILLSKVIKLFF